MCQRVKPKTPRNRKAELHLADLLQEEDVIDHQTGNGVKGVKKGGTKKGGRKGC